MYSGHYFNAQIKYGSFSNQSWPQHKIANTWDIVLDEWDPTDDKKRKFVQHLTKQNPIPIHHRSEAWFILSGGADLMNDAHQTFTHLHSLPCKVANLIEKDLKRTYGSHTNGSNNNKTKQNGMRKSLHCLKRILIAYANIDPSLAYCQGMNYIASFLIEIFGGLNEEQAFWTFVAILTQIRSLFIAGLPGFIKLCDNFKKLCAHHMPDLYNSWSTLPESDAIWTTILTTWFHTLFVYPAIDHSYVAYIWDIFFTNDFSIFMNLAITIIADNEKKLSFMNFMELNNFFKYIPSMNKCGDRLINYSLKLSLHTKYINECRDMTQFDWHGNGEKKMKKKYAEFKEQERKKELRKDVVHNKTYNKSLSDYNLAQQTNDVQIIDIDDNKETNDVSDVSSSLTSFNNNSNASTAKINPILNALNSNGEKNSNSYIYDKYSYKTTSLAKNSTSISSFSMGMEYKNDILFETNENIGRHFSQSPILHSITINTPKIAVDINISDSEKTPASDLLCVSGGISPGCMKNLSYDKMYDIQYVDDDDDDEDDDMCTTPSLKNLDFYHDIVSDYDDDDDEDEDKSDYSSMESSPQIFYRLSATMPVISLITPRISVVGNKDGNGGRGDGRNTTTGNFIAPFFRALKKKKNSH